MTVESGFLPRISSHDTQPGAPMLRSLAGMQVTDCARVGRVWKSAVTPITQLSRLPVQLKAVENNRKLLKVMVGAAGLEPATLSLEDSVSIENREHMRSRR